MNNDYAIDIPDERDWEYNAIFGADPILPSFYIIDDGEYQNQKLEEVTRYMCVFYSSSHGSNIQNYIEGGLTRIGGKELWLIALEKNLLDPKAWALIQSWPKLLKAEGYIDWWAKVSTMEEIRGAICNHRPIIVWSNKIDWKVAKASPFIATEGVSYWHAFIIIWYDDDDELLICKNSYWNEVFDEGVFYIKYSEYSQILFPSKYAIIDSKDAILEYKEKVMEGINIEKAKEAFEKGLWNWENATQTASREEVATMVLRGLEKLRDGQI